MKPTQPRPHPDCARCNFRLRVTAKHIEYALPRSHDRNAIALALRDQVPGIDPRAEVDVTWLFLQWRTLDGAEYAVTGQDVNGLREWIECSQYEAGVGAPPRTFDLGDLEIARVEPAEA